MSKQPDNVRANSEEIEMFLVLVSGNENELIEVMLKKNPTLINAVDERGNTAVKSLIYSETSEKDLTTLKTLMRYNPDLKIANEKGYNAWSAIQLLPKNPYMIRQVVSILDPNFKFREYGNAESLPLELEKIAKELAKEDAKKAVDEAKTYYNNSDMRKSIKVINEIDKVKPLKNVLSSNNTGYYKPVPYGNKASGLQH